MFFPLGNSRRRTVILNRHLYSPWKIRHYTLPEGIRHLYYPWKICHQDRNPGFLTIVLSWVLSLDVHPYLLLHFVLYQGWKIKQSRALVVLKETPCISASVTWMEMLLPISEVNIVPSALNSRPSPTIKPLLILTAWMGLSSLLNCIPVFHSVLPQYLYLSTKATKL